MTGPDRSGADHVDPVPAQRSVQVFESLKIVLDADEPYPERTLSQTRCKACAEVELHAMRSTSAFLAVGVSLWLSAAPVASQLSEWARKLGLEPTGSVGDSDTIAGLKEALYIGAENAVLQTGQLNGYFRNEAIKILIPENLQMMEQGLRMLGQGERIEEFVLSMNRAAEKAAPFAKSIFWEAILHIDFDDAREILTGGETAATDYFKAATGDQLAEAFLPVVRQATEEVGVTRQYKDLVGRYQSIPFAQVIAFDVDRYVVDKALDGLFYVLAEEERKIRTDPAARVTDLLRKVFGGGL